MQFEEAHKKHKFCRHLQYQETEFLAASNASEKAFDLDEVNAWWVTNYGVTPCVGNRHVTWDRKIRELIPYEQTTFYRKQKMKWSRRFFYGLISSKVLIQVLLILYQVFFFTSSERETQIKINTYKGRQFYVMRWMHFDTLHNAGVTLMNDQQAVYQEIWENKSDPIDLCWWFVIKYGGELMLHILKDICFHRIVYLSIIFSWCTFNLCFEFLIMDAVMNAAMTETDVVGSIPQRIVRSWLASVFFRNNLLKTHAHQKISDMDFNCEKLRPKPNTEVNDKKQLKSVKNWFTKSSHIQGVPEGDQYFGRGFLL